MKTIINGKPLQAMLDTGTDTVYIEVSLSYTKERLHQRDDRINERSLPIESVTRGALI